MGNVRNALLRDALRQYCKEALILLDERVKAREDVPVVYKVRSYAIAEPGMLRQWVDEGEEVEWGKLVDRNWEHLRNISTFRPAIRALEGDEQAAKHLGVRVSTCWSTGTLYADIDVLYSLLRQLLHEQEDLGFRDEIFNRIYRKIEDYFYRDVIEYRLLSPLGKFRMKATRIELGSRFSLIRIPEREERQNSLSEPSGFPSFRSLLFQEAAFGKCALELCVRVPKVIGDATQTLHGDSPDQIARATFQEACSVLRLFKNGNVGHEYILAEPKSWTPGIGVLSLPASGPQPSHGEAYALSSEAEIGRFLGFWQQYEKNRKAMREAKGKDKDSARVEVALRRFNLGYERARLEDMLIDYAIGFESLLLGGAQQELGYRMALRGAALLGKAHSERKEIFHDLKTAYDVRSRIVHGSVPAPEEPVKVGDRVMQFDEFVAIVEGHLRYTIREFLDLFDSRRSQKDLLDDLDEKIASGFEVREKS